MKIINIIFATLTFFAVSCTSNPSKEEHGHEHNTEEHGHAHDSETHDHDHDETSHPEQEEFTVEGGSLEHENDTTHVHEDGSKHHDH